MLAPRRAGSLGASTFDRILILPTSTAPRNAPPAANAPAALPRPLPRPQVLVNPNSPGDQPDASDDNPSAPADLVPQPRIVRPPQPLPGSGVVVPTPASDPDDAATEPVIVGGTAPTSGNPFGIPAGSSARPGVIAPAPQQPAPNQR